MTFSPIPSSVLPAPRGGVSTPAARRRPCRLGHPAVTLPGILLYALLCAAPAGAARVPDLGLVDESVSDNSESENSAALTRALERILRRLTGRPAELLPNQAAFQKNPQRYLLSDTYFRGDHPESSPENTDAHTPAQAVPERPLYLRFRFNLPLLEELLRAADIPILGEHRPRVLLWVLVSEIEGQRFLVNTETEVYASLLLQQAAELGLPILFPFLDLEEEHQLSVSDLLYVHQAVLEASRRYDAESVLILVLRETLERTWRGEWSWYAGDTARRAWESRAPEAAGALRNGLLRLAGHTTRRYGISRGAAQHRLEIHVLNADGFSGYARVIAYLESLASVMQVRVLGVEADRLDLQLETHGDLEALREKIHLGGVLYALPQRQDTWFSLRQ